jgi:hypothetical protein
VLVSAQWAHITKTSLALKFADCGWRKIFLKKHWQRLVKGEVGIFLAPVLGKSKVDCGALQILSWSISPRRSSAAWPIYFPKSNLYGEKAELAGKTSPPMPTGFAPLRKRPHPLNDIFRLAP